MKKAIPPSTAEVTINIIVSILCKWTHLNLIKHLQSKYYYNLHLIGEETITK